MNNIRRIIHLSSWAAFIVFTLIITGCSGSDDNTRSAYNASCVTNITTYTVRGSSLSGVIEPGATIRVLEGYHRCNTLVRDDIILYNFAGDDVPIIKIIRAVPGDRWYLQGCNIVVNNKTLTTTTNGTTGAPYCIGDARRLQLYVTDYPIIPANTYLLMGNQPGGSLDGSVFGLIDAQDIIGKVEVQ